MNNEISSTLSSHVHPSDEDRGYDAFVARMSERFASIPSTTPLFVTDVVDLFERYLDALPQARRQYHNCSSCRRFFDRYGSLVTVGDDGKLISAIWNPDEAPAFYAEAVAAMKAFVERTSITSVFISTEKRYGTAVTNDKARWTHYAVTPHPSRIYKAKVPSAYEAVAAKSEDYRTVRRALAEYRIEHLEAAEALLRSGALPRSEKVLGNAQWLSGVKQAKHPNLVWRAVATAPVGFCHPRASMLGALLDDIVAGKSVDEIRRSFGAKMDPLQYQRPQAAPSSGAIDQAEKLFETLGLAPALERRFARLEEVTALWKPQAPAARAGGVFAALRDDKAPALVSNQTQTVTWAKFARDVLPSAQSLEVVVPPHGDFIALVTACYADAPPILRWDREDARNPVSWYRYYKGSSATVWQLRPHTRVPVTAVTLRPCHWTRRDPASPEEVMLLLEGARDLTHTGLALFPETLRSELHGVRSVIEAFSKRGKVKGAAEATACGIAAVGATVYVTTGSLTTGYRIDRLE